MSVIVQAIAIQCQADELRELGNVLRPHVRDLETKFKFRLVKLREAGNAIKPRVRDLR